MSNNKQLDDAIAHCQAVVLGLDDCECKKQHEYLLSVLIEKAGRDRRVCGNCIYFARNIVCERRKESPRMVPVDGFCYEQEAKE